MKRLSLMRKSLPIVLILLLGAYCYCQEEFRGQGYKAVINDEGMLSSLRISDVDVLGGPLEFCPGTNWTLEQREKSSDGKELRVSLRSERGEGEIRYQFGEKGIAITLLHRLKNFQSWQISLSKDVIGVENLQNNTVTGAEAIQYLDRGEIRATPMVGLARVQRARLYLRNGAKVLFWHDGWGAPFNLDEIGSFRGFAYRRNLLESDKPMRIYFQMESPPGKQLQPAPAFVPVGEAFSHLFYSQEPIRFTLKFTEETLDRLKLAKQWKVSWIISDFWNRIVGEGSRIFESSQAMAERAVSVTLNVKESGWFSVLFRLEGGNTLPSEFRTRFAVVRKHPAFPERPKQREALSDYGYIALLGMKCNRESHNLANFFPERGKANWEALDRIMEEASSEAKRWGVNWFFQAIMPEWCKEEDYEQIAYEMVSRYKDKCKIWEVENEPNFRFSPEDYIRRALLPFAKGAKRADPDCQILGPACVSVPWTLRFMQAIVAQGALQYLDGVSTHTYHGPGEPWELFGNPLYLQHLKELAKGKPLWQTEQGYWWDNVSKQQFARYVVRQFLNSLACGITNERHFYYYPVHHGFEPMYLVEMGSSEGLNGTLEPGAVALRVMNEEVAGLSVGDFEQPLFGVYSLRFLGREYDVIAWWTLDFPISLKIKGCILEAIDFMGNPLKLQKTGTHTLLPLNGYALYTRVPHGERISVVSFVLGINYASLNQGANATASSFTKEHPPEHAIDEKWFPRDPAPGIPERTYWEDDTEGASPSQPDWLQITFPKIRTIDRVLLLTPLPAVDGAVPRDFLIQVSLDGRSWRTVAQAKDVTAWATMLTFKPTKALHLRLVIRKVNDGWHLDGKWMFMVSEDFKRYTSLKTRVLELMVFGPKED